ncbi:uncharacterized protein EV154DRAFT_485457 [Mucor mucedo]|uniref:uncharacterized protein n=1 Tax=Mucor mucedo TaxID=29922 RepID=UPI00221EEE2E|nr:uncharacterized protein EV154DRAFT_485457 [Mucor mucedo]KAI7884136.1 hypothetical protein EV154DRAFT_485457 [Mucor mucedo]
MASLITRQKTILSRENDSQSENKTPYLAAHSWKPSFAMNEQLLCYKGLNGDIASYAGDLSKSLVNHTDGSKPWETNSLKDLLEAWRQYLSACSHKHEYCLEKYHCNPDIPGELYNQFGLSGNCTIESPVIRCSTYSNKVNTYMTTKTWNKKDLCKRLNKSESNFSRLLVWPAVEVSVDLVEALEFLPGEYALKSTNENYNADGCVVDEDDDEMFFLETSGKLMLNEKWKYGYDHIYLERSLSSLIDMKQEYEKYEVQRMLGGTESRTSLVEMVNMDLQKPLKGDG